VIARTISTMINNMSALVPYDEVFPESVSWGAFRATAQVCTAPSHPPFKTFATPQCSVVLCPLSSIQIRGQDFEWKRQTGYGRTTDWNWLYKRARLSGCFPHLGHRVQWFRIALSNGLNWAAVSPIFHLRKETDSPRNVVFFFQNTGRWTRYSNPKRNMPMSEH
jgi:hypothetical protein